MLVYDMNQAGADIEIISIKYVLDGITVSADYGEKE